MIISITPNPALDVSGEVKELVPNEKSYVQKEIRLPGGNGINSARIAHRLGSKVMTTGFLGGESGKELAALLKNEKIPQRFIEIKGRTRTNVTISPEQSHEQTRLSFPGPRILPEERQRLIKFLKKSRPSLVLIGGSLPTGITSTFIKKIITENHSLEIPTFLDVPGKNLREIVASKPFFIKPNLIEFQEMTGSDVTKIADVVREARKLSSKIALQCISSVEGGALLVTQEYAWFGKIPKIKVESTVGAGDSMVGAMAHYFQKNQQVIDEGTSEGLLRAGLAAACATLSHKGLTLATKSMIHAYLPKIIMERID